MSDGPAGGTKNFLAQMVERASDSASVVRPRVPGLFEPVSTQRNPVFSTLGQTDAGDPARATSSRDDAFFADHAHSRDSARVPTSRSFKSVSVPMDNDLGAKAGPFDALDLHAASRGEPARHRQMQPVPTKSAFGSMRDNVAETGLTARRLPSSAMQSLDVPQTKPVPGLPAKMNPPANTTIENGLPKNTLTPKRVPEKSPVAMREAARETRHADAAVGTRAEPIVHISIGRVEVRALTQAPVNPQQRTNNPRGPMSLDEYLNRKDRAR